MNTKITIIILLIAVLTACAPAQEAQPLEPLKIGLVLPLTGPSSQIGNVYLEGAQLAVDDLNIARILNRPIQLVVEDTGSEPKNAVTAMQKLISVNDIKFFATITSSHGLVLKPIAISNNVLLFGDVAHPNMTGGSQLIFRHSNIAEDEAIILINKIVELGGKRVGILYSQDDYGHVLNKLLVQQLANKRIFTQSESFDPKANEFRTETAKATTDIDIVVVIGVGAGFNLVFKQLKESGFTGIIVSNIGFPITRTFELGTLVEGVYHSDYSYTYLNSWQNFTTKYNARYNKEPQSFHSISYGSIELLVNGIAKAGTDDPTKVAETLLKLKEFKGTYETIQLNEKGDAVIPLSIKQFNSKQNW